MIFQRLAMYDNEVYRLVSSDFAQLVKQQADIVRIIGEYITLKKSGAQNYAGLCPFHGEKTASFSVHAVRQFYYCFGCHESGDVFSFVQKIENVGFPEAVKIVAQKCGIPLPKREFSTPEEAEESRQRGKLLELHELATTWFEEQLRSAEGARAREYLTGRGLTAEAIAKFRIGYAPDSFNALRDRLQGTAPPDLLRLSGLLSSKEQQDGSAGPLYARFRKRITFPIHNESGRVIAFTARALDSDEKSGPKYMNSPETPLYSEGPGAVQSRQGAAGDPATGLCPAGGRPDGLHHGVHGGDSRMCWQPAERHLPRCRSGCSAATPSVSSSISTRMPPARTPRKSRSPCSPKRILRSRW